MKAEPWRKVENREDIPERVPLETMIADSDGVRNEAILRRVGNLWWFPDGSMYVYYNPTHWRPIN